jgi:hypothetical protein
MSDLRLHDLSHEAVSRLVEVGLSDQEVSAMSWHKSMQKLKRCTHLRAEAWVDRFDLIASAKSKSELRGFDKSNIAFASACVVHIKLTHAQKQSHGDQAYRVRLR